MSEEIGIGYYLVTITNTPHKLLELPAVDYTTNNRVSATQQIKDHFWLAGSQKSHDRMGSPSALGHLGLRIQYLYSQWDRKVSCVEPARYHSVIDQHTGSLKPTNVSITVSEPYLSAMGRDHTQGWAIEKIHEDYNFYCR